MSIEAALRRHAESQDWPEPPWAHVEDAGPRIAYKQPNAGSWDVVVDFPLKAHMASALARPAQVDAFVELRRLADEWKAATLFTSSTQEMFLHPAYQKIIGFGEKALPFLIDELRSSDDYWFWALSMITREDPVPAGLNGDYRAMKAAWLNWAANHGL